MVILPLVEGSDPASVEVNLLMIVVRLHHVPIHLYLISKILLTFSTPKTEFGEKIIIWVGDAIRKHKAITKNSILLPDRLPIASSSA